jgi:hypothetical protein
MKKIFGLALGLLLATGAMAQEAPAPEFTVVKQNAITSIKNQNQAGTCWCYSSLAFIESELLRMGQGEYDFSQMFIVHKQSLQRAEEILRENSAKQRAASEPIKTFAEDAEMVIKSGIYGPYISFQGKNYRLPRSTKVESLGYVDCQRIIAKSKK